MAHGFGLSVALAVVLSGGLVLWPVVSLAQDQQAQPKATAVKPKATVETRPDNGKGPPPASTPATKPVTKPVTKNDPAGKAATGPTTSTSQPKQKKLTVPLAPTPDELQRQRAASQRNADEKKDEARASRGRLPTQLGNTSGPSAPQGAGTVQDRKAATIDASGPNSPFRR